MKKFVEKMFRVFIASRFMVESYASFVESDRNKYAYNVNARRAFLCADALFKEAGENETEDRLKFLEDQGNC